MSDKFHVNIIENGTSRCPSTDSSLYFRCPCHKEGVTVHMTSRRSLISLVFALLPLTAVSQEVEIDFSNGKSMYDAWCGRCHGLDGKGIVAEELELEAPPPDFSDCSFNSREPRKDWKAVITHGGQARGLSMSMPAWGEALTEKQIDLMIEHIKTFCPDRSWPQGELNFRRAQVTAKAFPENEALLIPTYTHAGARTSTTRFVYEERIGPKGQWEVSLPFSSNHSSSVNGLGDIEVAGKILLHDDLRTLSVVSAGLEVGLPTGDASSGLGSGTWKLVPFLAAGKDFGPFFLQSSIKYEHPLKGNEKELVYALAFTYPLIDGKKGLIPMLEFHGITSLGEGHTTLFLTPQLYVGLVKRGHIALSIGTQFPVAGEKLFDYRIVAFFLWEYADGGLWW